MKTATAYDPLILEHYEAQGREHGLSPASTMLDRTIRERETHVIQRFVQLAVRALRRRRGRRTLALCDVGCGNGYTLSVLAERFPRLQLHGIEYTPALRALAAQRFRHSARVRITGGDLRHLGGYDAAFDIVICQRVLINLLNRDDQQAGLRALARILKPGGLLLAIEAFEEPAANLNAARAEFDLPAIPVPPHNLNLTSTFFASEPSLVPFIGSTLDRRLPDDFLPSNFLSSHYFIARVFHPLVLGQKPFIRNSHFVRFFTEAIDRPIGEYAPVKAYAFRKTGSALRVGTARA